MIDEKKIEEAAFKFGYDNGGSYGIYTKANVIKSFKDGVNWYLDNLWHPASEEPEKDKPILIKRPKLSRINMEFLAWSFSNDMSWNEEASEMKIISWLYVDDLLKGGK